MHVCNKTKMALLAMPGLVAISGKWQLMRWLARNDELKKALVEIRRKGV